MMKIDMKSFTIGTVTGVALTTAAIIGYKKYDEKRIKGMVMSNDEFDVDGSDMDFEEESTEDEDPESTVNDIYEWWMGLTVDQFWETLRDFAGDLNGREGRNFKLLRNICPSYERWYVENFNREIDPLELRMEMKKSFFDAFININTVEIIDNLLGSYMRQDFDPEIIDENDERITQFLDALYIGTLPATVEKYADEM